MYAVVRCQSKAAFERIRDDLLQRGQKCFPLGEPQVEEEDIQETLSQVSSSSSNGENDPCYEDNVGVSALDLLGEQIGEDEPYFEGQMIFQDEKPTDFNFEAHSKPSISSTFEINCCICTQSVRYKPQTEWSQKCNHVLQHLAPVRYECPYCGKQERIKGVLYDHLVETHNGGTMAVPIPAVIDPSEANRFLTQLEQCFPQSEQESLTIPDDHLPSEVRDVIYYYFQLKPEISRKYYKNAPVRLKCAKCNSCISKGPMEEQLKFEHALNHSHLTWITCSKCQATFTEKDSFFMHNRAMHHAGGFPICKDREDLSEEDQNHVDRMVAKLFPKELVQPSTSYDRVTAGQYVTKKNGPSQRKSRLKQVLPMEMDDQEIVSVKLEENPLNSVNIFDSREIKLEHEEEGLPVRTSRRKRKLVAS